MLLLLMYLYLCEAANEAVLKKLLPVAFAALYTEPTLSLSHLLSLPLPQRPNMSPLFTPQTASSEIRCEQHYSKRLIIEWDLLPVLLRGKAKIDDPSQRMSVI